MVVEDGSSQVECITHYAAVSERQVAVIGLTPRLRGWKELRKRRDWRDRTQSGMKLFAMLLIWWFGLVSPLETRTLMEIIFPGLKSVPVLIFLRRKNMWM